MPCLPLAMSSWDSEGPLLIGEDESSGGTQVKIVGVEEGHAPRGEIVGNREIGGKLDDAFAVGLATVWDIEAVAPDSAVSTKMLPASSAARPLPACQMEVNPWSGEVLKTAICDRLVAAS